MREPLPQTEIERARELAARAYKAAGDGGFAAVAERCGVKRSAISMFVRNKYPAGESGVARDVLAALDGFTCPYLNQTITQEACRTVALAEAPTHNPFKLTHWQACRRCPGKPEA